MSAMVEVACRDPIVSRDGRPFGAGQGNRMRSLEWLLPSVVAGSLRTAIGKRAGRDFSPETASDLLEIEIAGPLPFADGQVYLPAPDDCLVGPRSQPLRAAPQTPNVGGCDWPAPGLRPVMLTRQEAPTDFKPARAPAWWPLESMTEWLIGKDISFDDRFLCAPTTEYRTHVRLNPETGAADEGQLFTTCGLPLARLPRYGVKTQTFLQNFAETKLSLRVRAGGWGGEALAGLDYLHPLGGERRLAHWKTVAGGGAWECPDRVREAVSSAARIRMALATPAIFGGGWKPSWLNDGLVGSPPGADVPLRLVAVGIRRWQAVSGWSLAVPRGPKAVRRMAPSGGVYFFETVDGSSSAPLAGRWLESVCDESQDRRDGFGLALWGIW